MTENQNREDLKSVFTDLFNTTCSEDEISAKSVQSWDSLSHIKLIIKIESTFGIKVPLKEIPLLYSDFSTILTYLQERRNKVDE